MRIKAPRRTAVPFGRCLRIGASNQRIAGDAEKATEETGRLRLSGRAGKIGFRPRAGLSRRGCFHALISESPVKGALHPRAAD